MKFNRRFLSAVLAVCMVLGLIQGAFAAEISAEYGPADYADIAVSTYARMLLYKKGEGVVAAANENGLYGLVDLSGRVIKDFQYKGMWVLDGGLFKYSNSTDPNNNTYYPDQSIQQGVIDSNGNILLPMGPYQISCSNKRVSVYSYYDRVTRYYTLDWEPISGRTLSVANDAPYVSDTADDETSAENPDETVSEISAPVDTMTDEDAALEESLLDEDTASTDVMPMSTTITIDDETIDPDETGDHTIAAEFGEDEYDDVQYIPACNINYVTKDGLWGITNMDGVLLVPLNNGMYLLSGPNPENYSVVASSVSEMEKTVSYLLRDGAVANTYEGREVNVSEYCRNLVFTTGGTPRRYGLMDYNGNILMEERYGEIIGHPADHLWHTFTAADDAPGGNNYAIYHGLYSQDGECILDDVYTSLYMIADGRYMVCRDGKYGVMAVEGTTATAVIPIEYDDFDLYGYQFNIFTKGRAQTAYTLNGEVLMESEDKIDVFSSELYGGSGSVWNAYYSDLDLAKVYDGYYGSYLPFVIRTSGTESGYATYYVDTQTGESQGYVPYRASNINEDGYFVYQDKNGRYGIGGTNGLPMQSKVVPDGVKYVPYSCFLGNNISFGSPSSYTWYEISSGVLPNGLTLNGETGEISGVPMASGKFAFSVTMGDGDMSAEYPMTLLIEDNTNSAVQKPNDYPITDPVGTPDPYDPNHFYKYDYRTEVLRIDGPYYEFMRLLIDGKEKIRGVHYEAREGSTVITIYGETFEEVGTGTHTIAAEFREGGEPDGTLKTVAQNYTIPVPSVPSYPSYPSYPSNPGTNTPSKNPTSKPESKPDQTPTPDPEPETPQASGFPFGDVLPSDWFYDDVKWAYEEEMMTGVSDTRFAPDEKISQATIVTVLARLAEVDLTAFSTVNDPTIESGMWYSAAAVWAKQSGLLPDYSVFTGEEDTSREEMAIMLVKYMRSLGIPEIQPENAVEFPDADKMSSAGNAAFQLLYHNGIFKGVGDNRMDPSGVTSRAQFAALIHRISVFVETT